MAGLIKIGTNITTNIGGPNGIASIPLKKVYIGKLQ